MGAGPRRGAHARQYRKVQVWPLPDGEDHDALRGLLLAAPDVDIISIATPNDLHAAQAVAAARAGKHMVLEKPTGMNEAELIAIRDAVRAAGVRTIVSFELHYNPFLAFARWLRAPGGSATCGSHACNTCRA